MKRNDAVIADFLNRKKAKNAHLYSNGARLINYNTCIAEWVGRLLLLNGTKYSRTTSKIQSELFRQARKYGNMTLFDVPMNSVNLYTHRAQLANMQRVLNIASGITNERLREHLRGMAERMNDRDSADICMKAERLANNYYGTRRVRARRDHVQSRFYLE